MLQTVTSVIILLQLLQTSYCRSLDSDNSDNVTLEYDHHHDDYSDHLDHLTDHHDYYDHYHYEEYNDDDFNDYETVYDAIRDELPEILTQVERRYKTHIQHHHDQHPLLSLLSQEPHTMTILMKPMKMEPKIKVRLLYERVPSHRVPNITHLDRPMIESIPVIRQKQTYVIKNLPRGKYIVCGEAMDHRESVFQESCFETKIVREESEDLQVGVKAIIVIAITIVIFVVFYNILYQVRRSNKRSNKA